MKRPSDDDAERASSPNARLEAFISDFLRKHPRFFVYLVAALVALILVAFIVAKMSADGA